MNHWLLVGALAFLVWASATSVFRSFQRSERWFLATAGTVLTLAFISLGLVRLGVYSLPAAAGSCVAIGAVLQVAFRRHRTDPGPTPSEPVWSHHTVLPLLVVAALFALYESHPTYFLLGGRDPGLYASFAAHIAKTGGLDLDLGVLSWVHRELGDLVHLHYLGVYSEFSRGWSESPSDLVPQFMHLYPALAANGFAAFGFEGLVRVNALVFALGIWSFYMVACRVLPFGWALAAAVALGLNAAVIWSARISMTEPLTVLLLFFATYLVFLSSDRRSTPIALIAGLLLGGGVLCRVDACLAVLVLVGNSLASLAQDAQARRRARWVAGGYLVASSIGWLDGYLHSYPYFHDLWVLGSLDKLLPFSYGAGAIALAVACLPRGWLARDDRVGTSLVAMSAFGVAALVIWLGYAYLVRAPAAVEFRDRAIVELGWYVTPLAYVLCSAGMAVVVRKRSWDRWLPLLCLAGGTIFVFTYNPAISPDHLWASRRWVPQVIPSISLFSVAALWFLTEAFSGWRRRVVLGASAAVAVLYAASTWRIASVFLFESMFEGVTQDYDELVEVVESIGGRRVVLANTWQVSSILTYVYGVPTVVLKVPLDEESAEALAGFTLISWTRKQASLNVVDKVRLGGRYPELREGGRPRYLTDRVLDLKVGIIAPSGASGSSPFPHTFRGSELPSKGGTKNEKRGTVRLGGDGTLQFGPYVDLSRGSYVVKWFGKVQEDGTARVDVSDEKGKRVHARLDVTLTRAPRLQYFASLPFTLVEDVDDAEFRLVVGNGAQVVLKRLEVHAVPVPEEMP
jgi:hypothetical protein